MSEIVVITGATDGVGRAFARRYARSGAKIAVLGRGLVELRDTVIDLVSRGASAALAIPCDVESSEQVLRAIARIEHELGPIDIWIDAPGDRSAERRRALRAGIALAVAVAVITVVALARRRR